MHTAQSSIQVRSNVDLNHKNASIDGDTNSLGFPHTPANQVSIFRFGEASDSPTTPRHNLATVIRSGQIKRLQVERILRARGIRQVSNVHISRANIGDLRNKVVDIVLQSGLSIYDIFLLAVIGHPEVPTSTILGMRVMRIVHQLSLDGVMISLSWDTVPWILQADGTKGLDEGVRLHLALDKAYGKAEKDIMVGQLSGQHAQIGAGESTQDLNTNNLGLTSILENPLEPSEREQMHTQVESSQEQGNQLERALGAITAKIDSVGQGQANIQSTLATVASDIGHTRREMTQLEQRLTADFGKLQQAQNTTHARVQTIENSLGDVTDELRLVSKRADAFQLHSSQYIRDCQRCMIVGQSIVKKLQNEGVDAVRTVLLAWDAGYTAVNKGVGDITEQIRSAPVWIARFGQGTRIIVQMRDKWGRDQLVLRCRRSAARPKGPSDPYIIPCLTYLQRQNKLLLQKLLPSSEGFRLGIAGDVCDIRREGEQGSLRKVALDLPEDAVRQAVQSIRKAKEVLPGPPGSRPNENNRQGLFQYEGVGPSHVWRGQPPTIALSWNIHGFSEDKLHFLGLAIDGGWQLADIVAIQETHLNFMPTLDGYQVLHEGRTKTSGKGGILLAVKTEWQIVESIQTEYYIICRAKQGNREIVAASVYMPPYNSIYSPEAKGGSFLKTMEQCLEDISKLQLQSSANSQIILLGDFNAHVGNLQEQGLTVEWQSGHAQLSQRHAKDRSIDSRGHTLMKLCSTSGIHMLNGRAQSDLQGEYTYGREVNRSTVDFAIVNNRMTANMRVLEEGFGLSDHAPLWVSMQQLQGLNAELRRPGIPAVVAPSSAPSPARHVFKEYPKLIFTEEGMIQFKQVEHQEIATLLDDWEGQEVCTSEQRLSQFEGALYTAASRFFVSKRPCTGCKRQANPTKDNLVRQPWYNHECQQLKHHVHAARRHLTGQQDSSLANFLAARNEYRACVRRHRSQYVSQLEQLRVSDPKAFWSVLRCRDTLCPISLAQLTCHYGRIFAPRHSVEDNEESFAEDQLQEDNWEPFTDAEVSFVVDHMKSGKSKGNSWVQAEILKGHKGQAVISALTSLFNYVSKNGIPEEWKQVLIVSVFKQKGSRDDPNSYRPIAVMPQLCKIFAKLLLHRLELEGQSQAWRARGQAGFRRHYRLEDNLVILQLIIQRSALLNRPLMWAYVDLEKAYDTVCRKKLWQVMRDELGVSLSMLRQIKEIYREVRALIVNREGVSNPLQILEGVKQGCPLSPYIFSLFLDRIEKVLADGFADRGDVSQGIVCLGAYQILILLFADDLILIAESHFVLQKQFHILSQFCKENFLKVSTLKTHIMCNKRISATPSIVYEGTEISVVTQYRYLGIDIDQTASVGTMISGIKNRSQIAFSVLRDFLHKQQWSLCATRLLLYDVYVRSVMLFGAPVWGVDISVQVKRQLNPHLEELAVLYRSGIRQLLGVPVHVRSEILLALAARPPLDVLIRKCVYRYCRSVLQDNAGRLVTQVAHWVTTIDNEQLAENYSLFHGLAMVEAFPNPSSIYAQYVSFAKEQFVHAQHLRGTPFPNTWATFVELALIDRRRELPLSSVWSWTRVHQVFPKALLIDQGQGVRALWAWPSWLLGANSSDCVRLMWEYFYQDAQWWMVVSGVPARSRWDRLLSCDDPIWDRRCCDIVEFVKEYGLAVSLWIDCRSIFRLRDKLCA